GAANRSCPAWSPPGCEKRTGANDGGRAQQPQGSRIAVKGEDHRDQEIDRSSRSISRAAFNRISAISASRRGPSRERTAEAVIAAAGRPSAVLIQAESDFVPCTRPTSRML